MQGFVKPQNQIPLKMQVFFNPQKLIPTKIKESTVVEKEFSNCDNHISYIISFESQLSSIFIYSS